MRANSVKRVTVLTAMGLLALPPLGWMQYRWISELAEASEAQSRAEVTGALYRVGEELDRGVARTHLAFVARRAPIGDRLGEAAEDEDALPVGRVFVVEETDSRWTARVWSRTAEALVPAETPAWWIGRNRRPGPLHPDPLAIVGPYEGFRRPEEQSPPFGPPSGPAIVVEIDLERFRTEYFPRVLARQLGPTLLREYALRIVRRDAPGNVIHVAGQADWSTPADAAIPMMRGIRRPGPPPPNGQPGGVWVMEAKHVEGGLDAVANRTRTRNLAVSMVTLLLLAAAIGMLARTAQKERELANLRMEFAAGVSHELRSPLSVIVSAAENLASGIIAEPERVKEYGALVREQGTRLNSMIDQVLRFSSLESGTMPLELTSVATASLLKELEIELRRMPGTEGFEWEFEPVDIELRADRSALHTALRNLAENAVRHAGAGKWLRLGVRPAGASVEFVIEDRGAGIPQEDLNRLFEPFYRGANSRAAQRRGSGLGLSLVERIARAHGGSVRAENRAEGGARFVLSLPFV